MATKSIKNGLEILKSKSDFRLGVHDLYKLVNKKTPSFFKVSDVF
jgi:hypothetical protein